MNAPMRKVWTQEEFFAWAGAQEGRYEFDGFAPVGMARDGQPLTDHPKHLCRAAVAYSQGTVRMREHWAVGWILNDLIVEPTTTAMTVLSREDSGAAWGLVALDEEDVLMLPEVGVEVAVMEFYEGIVFADE